MEMPVKKKVAKRKTAVKKPVSKAKVTRKAPASKAKPVKAKAKAATKKAPAAKKAVVAVVKKPAPAVSNVYSKTQLLTTVAECSGVSKKDVASVFDALYDVIEQHIKRRGPQLFTLPGLAKIKVINKPATKARKGINPFTGEPTVFKAKPARNVVKVLALKKLKEMAK